MWVRGAAAGSGPVKKDLRSKLRGPLTWRPLEDPEDGGRNFLQDWWMFPHELHPAIPEARRSTGKAAQTFLIIDLPVSLNLDIDRALFYCKLTTLGP